MVGSLPEFLGIGVVAVAAAYVAVALVAVIVGRKRKTWPAVEAQPVSVLKPLHGDEPHLSENLRSFCAQDYPKFQLVFGVQKLDDPAADIARVLQSEFPQLDIEVVVDARRHGSNPKVSNLINLYERARHDWLVIADSDVRVTPDYLREVTALLADANVGVVACLYRGHAGAGIHNRLGAAYINDWFMPSVQLSRLFGVRDYCGGATMALRRDTLECIGGFSAVKDQLADDWWLGHLSREQGLRTEVPAHVVSTDVVHRTPRELWAQEMRWMRTTRLLAPLGFAFLFVTMTTPMLALGLLLAPTTLCATLATLGLALRVALHLAQNPLRIADVLLIPLRDFLLLAEWFAAVPGGAVQWRGQRLKMDGQGSDKLRPPS